MARSRDKKRRMKLEQIGRYNPEHSRLGWNGVDPTIKRTPTLVEKLNKESKKKKWSDSDNEHSTFDLKKYIV